MRRTPDNFPSVLITLHYHTQHIVIPLRFIPDFRTIFIYTRERERETRRGLFTFTRLARRRPSLLVPLPPDKSARISAFVSRKYTYITIHVSTMTKQRRGRGGGCHPSALPRKRARSRSPPRTSRSLSLSLSLSALSCPFPVPHRAGGIHNLQYRRWNKDPPLGNGGRRSDDAQGHSPFGFDAHAISCVSP